MAERLGRKLDLDKTVELTRSALHKLSDLGGAKQQPVLLAIAGPALGRTFALTERAMVHLARDHNLGFDAVPRVREEADRALT